MPKGCAHIANTKSTEYPEPRNQGGTMGYSIREICHEFICIYVQLVSLLLELTTQKSVLWYKLCIGIYMK